MEQPLIPRTPVAAHASNIASLTRNMAFASLRLATCSPAQPIACSGQSNTYPFLEYLVANQRAYITGTTTPYRICVLIFCNPDKVANWLVLYMSKRVRSSAGMKGRGKREIPEIIRRPAAYENPRAIRSGIKTGSTWWEASMLTAQPPQPAVFIDIGICQPMKPVVLKTPSFATSRNIDRKSVLAGRHPTRDSVGAGGGRVKARREWAHSAGFQEHHLSPAGIPKSLRELHVVTIEPLFQFKVNCMVLGTDDLDARNPTAIRIHAHRHAVFMNERCGVEKSSSELEWCNSFLCRSYIRSQIEFRTTMVQPGISEVIRTDEALIMKWSSTECKGGGGGREPQENSPTSSIIRHHSHVRKSGSDSTGNRTRLAVVGGERPSHYTTSVPHMNEIHRLNTVALKRPVASARHPSVNYVTNSQSEVAVNSIPDRHLRFDKLYVISVELINPLPKLTIKGMTDAEFADWIYHQGPPRLKPKAWLTMHIR
ncbi:hypothetical protein PR048_016008 [Dryococelus australis]|uniref:Uncharacterized protein n=1 Tax=Dryococelus australis TaxID=614101 RepID=A0ABQ9HJ28_9NEOP|nr:hypothetical protein PR048_016008 [Dryococelus australis]